MSCSGSCCAIASVDIVILGEAGRFSRTSPPYVASLASSAMTATGFGLVVIVGIWFSSSATALTCKVIYDQTAIVDTIMVSDGRRYVKTSIPITLRKSEKQVD